MGKEDKIFIGHSMQYCGILKHEGVTERDMDLEVPPLESCSAIMCLTTF
jgi:hypothetical protein